MTDDVIPPITDVSGGTHDPAVRRAAELAVSYTAARGLAHLRHCREQAAFVE